MVHPSFLREPPNEVCRKRPKTARSAENTKPDVVLWHRYHEDSRGKMWGDRKYQREETMCNVINEMLGERHLAEYPNSQRCEFSCAEVIFITGSINYGLRYERSGTIAVSPRRRPGAVASGRTEKAWDINAEETST